MEWKTLAIVLVIMPVFLMLWSEMFGSSNLSFISPIEKKCEYLRELSDREMEITGKTGMVCVNPYSSVNWIATIVLSAIVIFVLYNFLVDDGFWDRKMNAYLNNKSKKKTNYSEDETELLEGICKECGKKIYIHPEHYKKDDNYCWECLDKLNLD